MYDDCDCQAPSVLFPISVRVPYFYLFWSGPTEAMVFPKFESIASLVTPLKSPLTPLHSPLTFSACLHPKSPLMRVHPRRTYISYQSVGLCSWYHVVGVRTRSGRH